MPFDPLIILLETFKISFPNQVPEKLRDLPRAPESGKGRLGLSSSNFKSRVFSFYHFPSKLRLELEFEGYLGFS